jgi:CRP-like cAMP-binding protein
MAERDPEDDGTVTSSQTSSSRSSRRSSPRDTRLGRLASFSELSDDLLGEIEASMAERRFAPSDLLMRQGEEGDSLMVVQEGEVEVSVALDRERHVLKRGGPGEVFGEMALLTTEPRTASVVALTAVRALVLPVAEFHRLARREPALAEVLSRLTAHRLGGETHDALSGKTFHGYAIRKRLGRGGMAVVYEAVEVATGRTVALKMMSHRFAFHDAAKSRFQQEADLIESFDHENIGRMFGRFEAFHTHFIVMESCDGSSLARILAPRRKLAPEPVRRILGQVAAALAYAHGRRIVHRDVKPSNVMVDRRGVVKLMDFGLARPLLDRGAEARGTIAGTPPYMAPEQLGDEPCGVAADLWGLGGLAWQMLAGKTLFRGRDFETLRREHRAWKVPDFAAAFPGAGEELVRLLAGSLVREPERRTVDLGAVASWAGPVGYEEIGGR